MPRYCPRCGEPLHSHSTTKGEARKGALVGSRLAYDDTPSKKKSRKKDPKLSRAMKEAYAKAHKQNGEFKKGWDRSRQLTEAHRLKRLM